MIRIDPTIKRPEGASDAVHMLKDFRTESGGIGSRTYEAGKTYRFDPGMRFEMEADKAELADLVYVYPNRLQRPVFDMVGVVPAVSKNVTSDGVDTWRLQEGKPCDVPSNIAVFLVASGYASEANNV